MILSGWKLYAGIGALVILSLVIWRVNHAFNEAAKVPELERELEIQKLALKIQSEKYIAAQNLTQTVSVKYENDISKRDAALKRLRQRPAACVPVHTASGPSSGNATHQPDQPLAGVGVSSSFLIDFAGSCETDRIKVNALQDFINTTWKANEQ